MSAVALPEEIAEGVHRARMGRGGPASNVYFVRSARAWVLVDTGWSWSGRSIERAAASLFGPASRPEAILLTDIHPDHSGVAGVLARTWRVPVYVHGDELPMARGRYLPEFDMPLDHWVVMPVMRRLPTRTRERIEAAGDITDVTRPLDPDGSVPGLPDWEWVATPGHTPGHVAYRRRGDGVLLSGDVLVTVDLNSVSGVLLGRHRLSGPPSYTTWDRDLAERSVEALAALGCRVLGPGHGRPMAQDTADRLRTFARGRRQPSRRRLDRVLVPVGNPDPDRYRRPPRLYARSSGWVTR